MSKRSRPHGSCIFCGQHGPLTDEDAIPTWLMRIISPAALSWGKNPAAWRKNMRPTPAGFRLKLPALCERCNSAWLGPIERRAKPKLLAWMAGVVSPLTQDDQRLLSFWAVKTAMTIQLAHPEASPVIPLAQYRELHRSRTHPPAGFRVWAQIAPIRTHGVLLGTKPVFDATAGDVAYEVSLDIRRLALRIVGSHGNDALRTGAAIAMFEGYPEAMHQIWPTTSQFLLTA